MPDLALTRAAVRTGVVGLALAALTAGGGAVALQTVSSPSPLPSTTAVPTPTPSPPGSPTASPSAAGTDADPSAAEQTAAQSRADSAAKAEAKAKADRAAAKADRAEAKADRAEAKARAKADRAAAKGQRSAAGTPVPVVEPSCDPDLNHGQNVSAYARSLPKGPGRGRQVSQFARSACGKR